MELEKDLASRKQRLDVVVVRRGGGPFRGRLPDGLEDLAPHNLITFKSHHDALNDWALKELTGHYVNYRKQCTPRGQPLLPESDFRLFAVCSRFPQNLADNLRLELVKPGVYNRQRGTDRIRVIVAGQVSNEPQYAPFQLFSASVDKVEYGAGNYQQRSEDANSLLSNLLDKYRGEGISVSYTMADFRREVVKEHFKDLTLEEQRQLVQNLTPEVRLAGLSREEIARYLEKLQPEQPARKRKPGRKP